MKRQPLSLRPGDGGVCLIQGGTVSGSLFAHFAMQGERLVIRAVLWRPDDAIDAAVWRSQPISQIEALANSADVRAAITERLDKPAMELAYRWPEGQLGERLAHDRRMALKLPAHSGAKYPDSFYERVARIYEWLSAEGRAPAKEIADVNEVPITTVHRWIKEARARKLLAPGERGRAG